MSNLPKRNPDDYYCAPFERRVMPNGAEVYYRDSDHSYHAEIKEKGGKWTAVQASRMVAVSTILGTLAKDALLDWAANLAREGEDWRDVRGKAGDRGTSTHDLVLRALLEKRTSLSDLDEEHRPFGQAAFRWLQARRPKVLEAECVVASIEHRYAGRFDLLADIAGERPRVDFKTVTKWHFRNDKRLPPFPENALQLDLYEGAAVECGHESADYGLVVRLGPDGYFDETPVVLDPERGRAVLGAYRARAAAVKALKAGLPELAEAA